MKKLIVALALAGSIVPALADDFADLETAVSACQKQRTLQRQFGPGFENCPALYQRHQLEKQQRQQNDLEADKAAVAKALQKK